jgi:hypothetical protein
MKTQPNPIPTSPISSSPIPDTPFEAAITHALEQSPMVAVPFDFAARVRASLPAQSASRVPRSLGRLYAAIAVIALLVTLCAIAPHATPSFTNIAFDLELTLLVELAGIAAWLTIRRSY